MTTADAAAPAPESSTATGNEVTFPMFVWGSAQRQIPMQINVVGTAMFLISVLIVPAASLRGRRGARAVA
jgi:spermidine/putrescine transport system permease protein